MLGAPRPWFWSPSASGAAVGRIAGWLSCEPVGGSQYVSQSQGVSAGLPAEVGGLSVVE